LKKAVTIDTLHVRNAMADIEKIKKEIIERLKPLDPERVILFGSYAAGIPNEESDVDLYVVTRDDYMPKSWREKNEIYLKISRELRSLRNEVPIDLIVHTKKMNRKFIELNSHFSREIISNGITLI